MPQIRWPLRSLVALALASAAAGCPWSVPSVHDAVYTCTRDLDCLEGYACDDATKRCVPGPGAPDGGAGGDAGPLDGGRPDAGPDGGPPDADPDGGPLDGGPGSGPDSGPLVDGGVPDGGGLPRARDDAVTTLEDTPVELDPRANDVAPEGQALRIVALGAPSLGAAALLADGGVRYTPAPDAAGTDAFSYTVRDEAGAQATATITITLEPVADPPRAEAALLHTTPGRPLAGALRGADPDGDPITFHLVDAPTRGTATVSEDGSFSYTPPADADSDDAFTFRTSDGQLDSPPVRVDVKLLDKLWTGAATASWSDPGSWSPEGVPSAVDDALVPASAARMPVVEAGADVMRVAVEPGATLEIAQGVELSVWLAAFGPPVASSGGFAGEGTLALNITNAGEVGGRLGRVRVSGSFDLVSDARVEGLLDVANTGRLAANGRALHVAGDADVHLITSGRGLVMAEGDRVLVDGDLSFFGENSSATSHQSLVGGEIRLRGDLVQRDLGGTRGLASTGTRFVFDGTAPQEVRFDTPGLADSRLSTVLVQNPAGVTLASPLFVTDALTVDTGAALAGAEVHVSAALPVLLGAYDVEATVLEGDLSLPGPARLPGALRVPRTSALRLAGHRLEVTGDVEVVDGSSTDGLHLVNDDDELVVGGALVLAAGSGSNTTPNFTAGRIVLRGPLFHQRSDAGDRAFFCQGTTLVLEGPGPQAVRFDAPSPDRDRLCDVEIPNPSAVTFETPAYLTGRLTMAPGAEVEGAELTYTARLPVTTEGYRVTTSTIAGAVVLDADALVHGAWSVQPGASLVVGPHRLEVRGHLLVNVDGSDDGLFLQDPAGEVIVTGDAAFDAAAGGGDTEGHLSAGTLRLQGNFTQASTAGEKSFISTGTRVVFEGEAQQVVAMTSPADNRSRFFGVRVAAGSYARFVTAAHLASHLEVAGQAEVSPGAAIYVGGDLVLEAGGALANAGSVVYAGELVQQDGSILTGLAPEPAN